MKKRPALPAESIRAVIQGKRFLAADRAAIGLNEIATWDRYLVRERRLLVPIDVQALYVPPDGDEPMVRLPMLVAGGRGGRATSVSEGMPEPFTEGTPRAAGVHLHWAMPDALLRGSLASVADGAANRLALPSLPDRWVVLRILLPTGESMPVVTGWVLESDRAVVIPLESWSEGGTASRDAVPLGELIDPAQLTGTVGGAVSWSAVYDAVIGRFAFHDPLTDIPTVAAHGVDRDMATYMVAGWWKDPASDPLDAARSNDSLHELLDRLRWRLLHEWGDAAWAAREDAAEAELRRALGLETGDRWTRKRPASSTARPGAARREPARKFVPMDSTFVEKAELTASSAFAAGASRHFSQPPWELRSSLLHGSIYGVQVSGAPKVDRRPASSTLEVVLGEHDGDVISTLAVTPGATDDERRATERLLAAFTSQKLERLGSSDGMVEVEEYEHAAAFSTLNGGKAGTDRLLQRVQTGGVGGRDLGRGKIGAEKSSRFAGRAATPKGGAPRHARPMDSSAVGDLTNARITFNAQARPTLIHASAAIINDIARSRVGDVLAPTEARVVDRPAPKFSFPGDPLVGIRGVCRSLRHGGDGRGSADGKLTCRWPTHVITEITGLVANDRFIPTLGSGAIPPEVLTLAREAMLHDPYHDRWVAQAVAPTREDRAPILKRLMAESVLRFGADGTYDGATIAFDAGAMQSPASGRGRKAAARARQAVRPGVHEQQSQVADQLLRYSLYRGADPDPVGVTTWAQPWVPMWLEWELVVDGLDPATLDDWLLGAVTMERATSSDGGDSLTLRGRALLTTGGASTLHSAVQDWLVAERARDTQGAGLVDDDVESALRTLDEAVQRLDLVTAALDGVRAQLLGFPASDGLHRPVRDGAIAQPEPVSAPRSLLAGSVRLTKARLLDTFGRTLEVPVDAVGIPARADTPEANTLQMTPRLLRPARWQFRLVNAATAVGEEGEAARVDEIEPTLQVSPVVGFVMPDHLDESLEIFDVNGEPIGELLHEAVSGGVMWEIAAGREGPADAGPTFGLSTAQLPLGRFAAGLVAADASGRSGGVIDPDGVSESALSALLRAIDTTLWSVDTFAALGSEHVAGLVGRPIAVVRAQLRLEFMPPDDVDLSDPVRASEWSAAAERASRYAFPVRIGEVTRSDDGVLGFFVDDDFSRFRLVDRAIAGAASDSSRNRGQFGLFKDANATPSGRPIGNPYIAGTDDADTLCLRIGQTVTLTIFMHPAGKATLTSGIVPRSDIALARDWVGPGLAALAPSLRTGPVLVETDLDPKKQVRLPKVSVFGKDQNFLWRDTPATWRTDAILAATQTALLPDTPAEFREGWIRVAPEGTTGATEDSGGAA